MKASSIVAFLVIAAIIFYVTGGGALFGVLGAGGTGSLPETTRPPNATFMGDEQANPFVGAEKVE